MFKTILLPLDGSELAEQALVPALALARSYRSRLILLRVPVLRDNVPLGMTMYEAALAGPLPEMSLDDIGAYLASVGHARADVDIQLETQIGQGDIAGCIVDTAAAEQVDLIVMSTHGYSGLRRWVLGSVTERVLSCAPCPVLTVRHEQPIRRMLIPLDGSRLAEQALAPGLAVARAFDAEVTLLRVRAVDRLESVELGFIEMASAGLTHHMAEESEHHLEHYLEQVAARYEMAGRKPATAVTNGPAAQAILEFAEAQPADLIVMATHGRTGLQRWLYGSVTEKVLRQAGRAMLIIRPD